jgi:glucose/mannose-6-phosphate isomerase
MTYEEGILEIPKQFGWRAEVLNKEKLCAFKRVIVLGMGGSRLGADVLNMVQPELDIYVHSDFDLPQLSQEALAESLIIANSYSGDTAETISGAKKAIKAGLNFAIVAGSGELSELAQKESLPYVKIPHNEWPARMMIGYDVMALSSLLGLNVNIFSACQKIDVMSLQAQGEKLAGQLGSSVPLIYTSNRFNELGYIWKVILNETAKIPAFNNRFPEIDHNEIAGFGRANPNFAPHVFILKDSRDTRVERRMEAMVPLLQGKGVPVTVVEVQGSSVAEQVVSSIILAHWFSVSLANKSKVDPVTTAIIEQFKKLTHDNH